MRKVAVKVIKRGCDTEQTLRRFRIEQQALSLMNHPHIARVFGAGATEDGRPYFAMEHVPGIPITKYCDAHRLSTPERLRLFLQVCAGVQHAHLKGIVHRDLKPGNLLVSHRDGEPTAKVIDFGVAKSIDHRLIEQTAFTQKGQVVGTPAYMSPEQADLNQLGVDTRTDVYSLGVVLYELLVGQQPLSSEVLLEGAWADMQQRIRELTPPSPSTRLRRDHETGQLAEKRSTDPTRLQRQIRGDLDVITMRALEKEPIRRFQSVGDLAADIERHLRDQPILARPPGAWYRARKFVRRNRTGTLAAAVALSALVFGGTSAWWNGRRAAQALERYELMSLSARVSDLTGRVRELPLEEGAEGVLEDWIAAYQRVMTQAGRVEQAMLELERSGEDAFLLARLGALRGEIEGLEREVPFVEERLRWVRNVRQWTVEDHADRWEQARGAIRTELGFDLPQQVGLVPLGRDPESGLWEFHHLPSAQPGFVSPAPMDGGGFATPQAWHDGFGVVFVLVPVPAGEVRLGGRTPAEIERGLSAEQRSKWFSRWVNERDARLPGSCFLLSKYELTQSQWKRVTGHSAGMYGEAYARVSDWFGESWPSHPVESVSAQWVSLVLANLGMELPSGDQWEYAARGGRGGLYWFESLLDGAPPAQLINCADASRLRVLPDEQMRLERWDDTWPAHAPVASMSPNPFGFYHVLGNVAELCRASNHPEKQSYWARGGSYKDELKYCSHAKLKYTSTGAASDIGIRPLWKVQR